MNRRQLLLGAAAIGVASVLPVIAAAEPAPYTASAWIKNPGGEWRRISSPVSGDEARAILGGDEHEVYRFLFRQHETAPGSWKHLAHGMLEKNLPPRPAATVNVPAFRP